MSRRTYDPLHCIPTPDAVRQRLAEVEQQADRLRILLEVAERVHLPLTTADRIPTPTDRREATHVSC